MKKKPRKKTERSRSTTKGSKRSARRTPGLPDPESVVGEVTFVSPSKRTYRIIKTDEQDAYDPEPSPPPPPARDRDGN